jgi:hypothetical protein
MFIFTPPGMLNFKNLYFEGLKKQTRMLSLQRVLGISQVTRYSATDYDFVNRISELNTFSAGLHTSL